MGIFRQFPYSNFHEMNMDWLLSKMRELEKDVADFIVGTKDIIINTVIQWLEDHPEYTTTVEDNSISMAKLTDEVRDHINSSLTRPTSLSYNNHRYINMHDILDYGWVSREDYSTLEAMAYNSLTGHIILGFAAGNTTPGMLVECDPNFNVIRRKTIDLGHCNDITYNPVTDKYYVATATNDNFLYVVDPYTLSEVDRVYLTGIDHGLNQISYKADENVYIGGSHGTDDVYLIDSEFNVVETLFMQTLDPNISTEYAGVSNVYTQGSDIYNNLFVSIHWIYRNTEKSICRVCFYNLIDYTLCDYIDIPIDIYDESEGLAFVNGHFIIAGYTRSYLTLVNLFINGEIFDNQDQWEDVTSHFAIASGVTVGTNDLHVYYNPHTREIRLAGALLNVGLIEGLNYIVNIDDDRYKPEDWYQLVIGAIGNSNYPAMIYGYNRLRIYSPSAQTNHVYFAAQYFGKNVTP